MARKKEGTKEKVLKSKTLLISKDQTALKEFSQHALYFPNFQVVAYFIAKQEIFDDDNIPAPYILIFSNSTQNT